MLFSPDMRKLLRLFEQLEIQYALVGGYAVSFHGYVRTTQNLDLLISPSISNAEKISEALDKLGFSEAGIPSECLEQKGFAIHLGTQPNQVSLLTTLGSVANQRIFRNLIRADLESTSVNIIALQDLVDVKCRSNRLSDQADAEELTRLDAYRARDSPVDFKTTNQ